MKKAKFILSAAGLLSIIAGAFAFKAQHKFSGLRVCYSQAKAGAFRYPTIYTTTIPSDDHFTLICTLTANPNPALAAVTTVTVNS